MSPPLLELEDVDIHYRTAGDDIRAATDISFTIDEGEYFGLVGESGSGKSTIAKAILGGLDDNGHIVSGTIRYRGTEIQDFSDERLSDEIRWKEISLIPQASMNSLDPLMRLSEQAYETAERHTDWGREKALQEFQEMFRIVGLPESRIHDYPHQFSGGMQQRAIIAIALFLRPPLVIADEPTTALDVIMQDQILQHLEDLREKGISLLLITHDISVIFETCDSMAVLHGGQIAETGSVYEIFDDPSHPYSILLQESFPDIRDLEKDLNVIEGQPPQLRSEVDYCTFADRCPWEIEECTAATPPLETVGPSETHKAACIREAELEELMGTGLNGDRPGGDRA